MFSVLRTFRLQGEIQNVGHLELGLGLGLGSELGFDAWCIYKYMYICT